jgi:2-oxo-3-hexenedioate decarboxylase
MDEVTPPDVAAMATRLIDAYDRAATLAPISAGAPAFDVAQAYDVLAEIERRRVAQGWRAVGRKIGFTNRTIWARYGVYQPMWAHVFAHTVHFAPTGSAALPLAAFVQPRIEPEVVFKLHAPPPATDDALAILACIEWIAPGFEIVQSHFPDWKFTAADCTAAFGLHGALVVGPPVALTAANRATVADALPAFTLQLRRGGELIDTGMGANVLGSPAQALAHLVRVLATQPRSPPLAAGEIVTTGTITDAWPVKPGQTWTSDYGTLGLAGLTLSFA